MTKMFFRSKISDTKTRRNFYRNFQSGQMQLNNKNIEQNTQQEVVIVFLYSYVVLLLLPLKWRIHSPNKYKKTKKNVFLFLFTCFRFHVNVIRYSHENGFSRMHNWRRDRERKTRMFTIDCQYLVQPLT